MPSSWRSAYQPLLSDDDGHASVHAGRGALRLHLACLFFAIGSSVWGYNVGVLSSVLVHPGFARAVGGLDPGRKGAVTALYYLGTLASCLLVSRRLSDVLGRRAAAFVGLLVASAGTALQAAAAGSPELAYGMVLVGRVVSGAGTAVLSTSVPLYQSEVSPAKQRGKFVVINHVGFIVGLAGGFWIGYAMTFWSSPYGQDSAWRWSLLVQLVPAAVFAVSLPFLPETPRWLVEHGHVELALASLTYFREGSFSPATIQHELEAMEASVAESRAEGPTSWRRLFADPSLFRRLWRATLLQFMAQMCGATAMKYYLPALLEVLGLNRRVALMAGGIESTLKIGMTVLDSLLIDRVGRRWTLTAGAGVMALAMLVNGVLPLLYPSNVSRLADLTCVVFIFIYAFGYSIGFGSTAWVYSSEIFPTSVRARGLNFAAAGGAVGSILVAQIWPVGIHRLGTKIYFFFMAVNLACVPIVWILYPETKGRALEDIDVLFGKISRPHSSPESPESRPLRAEGGPRMRRDASQSQDGRVVATP